MRALWKLARRQLGLFTRAQALQLVTNAEVRTLVRRGHVRQVRRGVWAVAGAAATYEQAVLAVLLLAGELAWASHRTAARLWGLLVPLPEAIDVLTLPNRRLHLEGVAQHRNAPISLEDVTTYGALRVTSVAKTLVDCAGFLPGPLLQRAVDDARRRNLLTMEAFELSLAQVDRGSRTGRHLVVPSRPVAAATHHPGGSRRELDVLTILRRAGLPLPVQQFPIVVAGRQRYLDYAYPARRIYLEWDGFAEHGLIRSTFDDDRVRDAELTLLGWLGLHFTSATTPEALVSRVDRALALRAA